MAIKTHLSVIAVPGRVFSFSAKDPAPVITAGNVAKIEFTSKQRVIEFTSKQRSIEFG